jgi:uncharacterized membrane protein
MSYQKGLALKSSFSNSLRLPVWRRLLPTEMDRLMACSVFFSCLLSCWGTLHSGNYRFLFLIWNLFLAYIPYFITARLSQRPQWIRQRAIFVPVFVVWLLFIPNAFYILTDLFHLVDHPYSLTLPLWFELVLILSFAWNGLLLGILSVRRMEKFLRMGSSFRDEMVFLYPIMLLNSLGVYIGRYLRYNSWDVITNPFDLTRDMGAMVFHPLKHGYAWDMIFCYSILLTLMYLMMKRISQKLQ